MLDCATQTVWHGVVELAILLGGVNLTCALYSPRSLSHVLVEISRVILLILDFVSLELLHSGLGSHFACKLIGKCKQNHLSRQSDIMKASANSCQVLKRMLLQTPRLSGEAFSDFARPHLKGKKITVYLSNSFSAFLVILADGFARQPGKTCGGWVFFFMRLVWL